MLLDSLSALIVAGNDVLQTTCGLSVTGYGISIIRQGCLTFPAVAELQIKGAALPKVHLGCDSLLCGQLAELIGGEGDEAGVETLSNRYLEQVLSELEGRNPRGTVLNLNVGPINLMSRGLRSFGIRLETTMGQLFILAEVPSRMEMEIAKRSDYLKAMEATYLPRDWENRQAIDSKLAVDSFLIFLRKVEGDVYFEIPGEDEGHFLHTGVLLDNGTFDGVRGLKFCTDLSAASETSLKRGDKIWAEVGIGDRALQFSLTYLGEGVHPLANGAELPCAFFEPPENVTISQRRLAFRIPVKNEIDVEIRTGTSTNSPSPWGDEEGQDELLFRGSLADLSFSGARISSNELEDHPSLEINGQVVCNIHFPDAPEPVSVLGIVRRISSRLVDRNERLYEVGLEFVIMGDDDRTSLEYVRQFVLAEQRSCLSRRIQVSGMTA